MSRSPDAGTVSVMSRPKPLALPVTHHTLDMKILYFCLLNALSAPRYSKMGAGLFLGCSIPEGRAIFAAPALKPCSTWMLVADARMVECDCKTRVIAIRLAFETLPNDGALRSHVAALALDSI
jgi:hypothetical protein